MLFSSVQGFFMSIALVFGLISQYILNKSILTVFVLGYIKG